MSNKIIDQEFEEIEFEEIETAPSKSGEKKEEKKSFLDKTTEWMIKHPVATATAAAVVVGGTAYGIGYVRGKKKNEEARNKAMLMYVQKSAECDALRKLNNDHMNRVMSIKSLDSKL